MKVVLKWLEIIMRHCGGREQFLMVTMRGQQRPYWLPRVGEGTFKWRWCVCGLQGQTQTSEGKLVYMFFHHNRITAGLRSHNVDVTPNRSQKSNGYDCVRTMSKLIWREWTVLRSGSRRKTWLQLQAQNYCKLYRRAVLKNKTVVFLFFF